MKRQINFEVGNPAQLRNKVITYFIQSGFRFDNTNDERLQFSHSGSVFDAWKTNPLKWGSEITVWMDNEIGKATFCINTAGQMNTAEERNVWAVFMNNFKTFLTNNIDFKAENQKAIALAKNSRTGYIGWAILGIVAGILVGLSFFSWTGREMSFITVPLMTIFFLNSRIKYRRAKAALE